ncbi:MAG: 50S ribosomal protein L3 [Thaumarchaeota archaeon]|jgi:large subunit ribosomal protein L3|nr:50S ribosomal protein L3 [Nitrososphaerota archaeon]
MGHAIITDDRESTPNFGKPLFVPFTVVAIPPMHVVDTKVYGYYDGYLINLGKLSDSLDISKVYEVRAVVDVIPKESGFSQKKPYRLEIPVSGKDINANIEYLKKIINQTIQPKDIISKWGYVDVIGVTKGKGFQGPVKRFGIKRKQHKSRKTVRAVGAIGPWHPASVMYTVPRAGQMGYQRRTIYNLRVLGVSKEPGVSLPMKKITSDYVLLNGSVQGPKGRPLLIRKAVRIDKEFKPPSILYLSLEGIKV